MSRLSSKLRAVAGGGIVFFCPGCQDRHMVSTGDRSPRWRWNGDVEKPTFDPSILVKTIGSPTGEVMAEEEMDEYDKIYERGGLEAAFTSRFGRICHSFVENGRIRFLDDCTHPLSGKTVDLPDMP